MYNVHLSVRMSRTTGVRTRRTVLSLSISHDSLACQFQFVHGRFVSITCIIGGVDTIFIGHCKIHNLVTVQEHNPIQVVYFCRCLLCDSKYSTS